MCLQISDVDEFARALRAVGEPIFGMDATQISMGQPAELPLFEVTERFGMETRTELILLQRTMVVVEGVARSLEPAYQYLGCRAACGRGLHQEIHRPSRAHGLGPDPKPPMVMARFGPRLPALVEQALIAQSTEPTQQLTQKSTGP